MKHTPKEIINALQVIHDECISNEDCADCPFYTGDSCRFAVDDEPADWSLNKNEWKAFVN